VAVKRAHGAGRKQPATAQDSIPYQRMWPDGVCRATDTLYTKTVRFEDINYQLAQNDDLRLAHLQIITTYLHPSIASFTWFPVKYRWVVQAAACFYKGGGDLKRILVVEDDEAINRLICMNLSVAGYEPVPVYDGTDALGIVERSDTHIDLALLDVMLPGADGFELLSPIRAHGIPVIYLTAKNDVESKVQGLRDGAEDYIVKPFEILELLVRIEKVLSRCGDGEDAITVGDIEIHIAERVAYRSGQPVPLTPILYDLLLLLARNRNIALTREKILAAVWGDSFLGESRTVDIHISQLRKKTGLSIVSVPKIGYRLEVDA